MENFLLKQRQCFARLSIRTALRSACNLFLFSGAEQCIAR